MFGIRVGVWAGGEGWIFMRVHLIILGLPEKAQLPERVYGRNINQAMCHGKFVEHVSSVQRTCVPHPGSSRRLSLFKEHVSRTTTVPPVQENLKP